MILPHLFFDSQYSISAFTQLADSARSGNYRHSAFMLPFLGAGTCEHVWDRGSLTNPA
jgi:hypothetical protein